MRVSLEWLKEFVDFNVSPKDLSMKLTMAGLEVESIEEMDGDIVFEINITPNRPDCLSILGIAREVSAVMNLPLKLPDYEIKDDTEECDVKVEISDDDLCCRYTGRVIKGVNIGESPEWMKKRLDKCGMRSINNVVDITNYVLLEMGHPLHAFDMDELEGKKIRVGRAQKDSGITTLDGVERKLPDGALLIWDATRPVAVAGIMGGADSEVKDSTKNIFLESAYFLPASVRRTSKVLGLKTESAYRFERGTDIEFLDKALDRAASLIAQAAGGRVSKKADAYPGKFTALEIKVRPEKVNRVIGISLSEDEMIDILKRLSIKAEKRLGFFIAIQPSFRSDIQRESDIIEEIARFYGYEKVPVTIPKTPISKDITDKRYSYISAIKESIRKSGFTEAINYSFINPSALDLLNIGSDDLRRNTMSLLNPIKAEEPVLRTTIAPSLIQNLVYNVSMGNREVRMFEASRVFFNKGNRLPEERHHLGAIYFREKTPSLWKGEAPDFYVVKGALESLLSEINIKDFVYQNSSEPFLHPGKSCDIFISDEKTGFIGALHPDITEKLGLKVSKPEIILLELDLDRLLLSIPESFKYTRIPKYPYIERDIAIIVDESLMASTIIEEVKSYESELIEDVSVFDFYKGKNIPQGKKSLAFSVRYRAKDRTLTDSEIEDIHSRLIRYITDRTGGTVRGG